MGVADHGQAADGTSDADHLEIAHVLFIDIVGYSRLPMDSQRRVIGLLQNTVRGTAEFIRAQAKNQLISLPTGDGMALVFFGSPEDPIKCAIAIDRALRDREDVKLRLGIHSGPVYRIHDINAEHNVSGAGINIAQRVMDCGDAGHILVSDEAARTLKQLSTWQGRLHDLGETEVKHGVRVHIHNLCEPGVGNPALPRVFAKAANEPGGKGHASTGADAGAWKRRIVLLAIAAVATAGGVTVWIKTRGAATPPPGAVVQARKTDPSSAKPVPSLPADPPRSDAGTPGPGASPAPSVRDARGPVASAAGRGTAVKDPVKVDAGAQARGHVSAAEKNFAEDRYGAAVAEYDKALALVPTDAKVREARGKAVSMRTMQVTRLLRAAGTALENGTTFCDYDAAVRLSELALAEDPASADAREQRRRAINSRQIEANRLKARGMQIPSCSGAQTH